MRLEKATREDFAWISAHARVGLTLSAQALKVVDAAGQIRAMVAYDNFTRNACMVHWAATSPAAWRRLVPTCFRYPFEYLKLGVVLGVVISTNRDSLRMAKAMGGRETHRIRDGFAKGVDSILFELRPEDCVRWLSPRPPVSNPVSTSQEQAHG